MRREGAICHHGQKWCMKLRETIYVCMCPTITFRMYGRRYLEHGSVHQKKHMHFGTMQDFKSFWAIHCKETRRKCQELERCATLFSSSTNTQCIKIFEFSWHKVILLQSDSLAKFQNSPLGVSHCQIFSRAYWSIVKKCNNNDVKWDF